MTLGGCATSQTVVAQTLVRLRLIGGVSSVALQTSTKPGGGGASGASGGAPCTGDDPVFSIQVNFEPLPSAATPSTQALTSSEPATGGKRPAAALSPGGSR